MDGWMDGWMDAVVMMERLEGGMAGEGEKQGEKNEWMDG